MKKASATDLRVSIFCTPCMKKTTFIEVNRSESYSCDHYKTAKVQLSNSEVKYNNRKVRPGTIITSAIFLKNLLLILDPSRKLLQGFWEYIAQAVAAFSSWLLHHRQKCPANYRIIKKYFIFIIMKSVQIISAILILGLSCVDEQISPEYTFAVNTDTITSDKILAKYIDKNVLSVIISTDSVSNTAIKINYSKSEPFIADSLIKVGHHKYASKIYPAVYEFTDCEIIQT